MGSKIHDNNKEIKIKHNARREIYDLDDEEIKITYWRSRNPKVSKVKYKDIILKNRYDFGKDAPKRIRNFAWLRKDKKIKDIFGVNNGKE